MAIIKVHRPYLKDGRFWHRWLGLTELCIDKAGAISGQVVTERLCIGLVDDLDSVRASIAACLERELIAHQKKIAAFVDYFELEKAKLFDDTRYIRHSRMEAFRAKQQIELTDELRQLVKTYRLHPAKSTKQDALELEARYDAALALLNNAEDERKRHNCAYIRCEAERHERYFKEVEETELSEEQIVASLTYDDANVTVAAAGSGKTSVMVSKVGHAIHSKLYEPEEIVVLAYNKKAAAELKERIRKRLKTTKIRARTFHALGLSILLKARAENGIVKRPKVINLEGKTGQRILKQLLSDLLADGAEPSSERGTPPDPKFANDLLDWVASNRYPIPAIEPFPDEDVIQHEKRYEALCRKIAKGARKKKAERWEAEIPTFDAALYVRSFEEARIANWMYLRGVKFEYEKNAPTFVTDKLNLEAPKNQQVQFYKPDFTFPNPDGSNKSYFYEHFGLDKNDKAPDFLGGRRYEERAQLKRKVMKALFEREDRTTGRPRFFETKSGHFTDGTFAQILMRELSLRSITVGPVSARRRKVALESFCESSDLLKFITRFLTSFRDSGLTFEEIEEEAKKLNLENANRALLFLRSMRRFSTALDARLGHEMMDFSQMLREAISVLLDKSRAPLPVKLVLVDEFQDISRLRAQLVQALLDQHPQDSVLYCVGDDWQAINRFSGANIGIFRTTHAGLRTEVPEKHPLNRRSNHPTTLGTTYRCPQGIADVAKWFIMRSGENVHIDKIVKATNKSWKNAIRVVEHDDSAEARVRELEAQLERIAGLPLPVDKNGNTRPPTVFILTRNRKDSALPDGLSKEYLESLPERYQSRQMNVTWQSMHSAKGLGRDYVLIVGMDCGYKGFPADFVSDPLLEILLPAQKSPIEEERRLFYVALTRAMREVTILATANRPSMFVHELDCNETEGKIEWRRMPNVVRHLCPHCKRGWLKLIDKGRKAGCMRYPFCGFSANSSRFPGLPS